MGPGLNLPHHGRCAISPTHYMAIIEPTNRIKMNLCKWTKTGIALYGFCIHMNVFTLVAGAICIYIMQTANSLKLQVYILYTVLCTLQIHFQSWKLHRTLPLSRKTDLVHILCVQYIFWVKCIHGCRSYDDYALLMWSQILK